MQEELNYSHLKLLQQFLLEEPMHLAGKQWDDEDASSTLGCTKQNNKID